MWLSDRRTFLATALALSLAGCGFSPAYGPGGAANRLQNAVLVDTPDTRDAYLLTRELENRLGRAENARYSLGYTLDFIEERMAISSDDVATRVNLIGKLAYNLRDLSTTQVLAAGTLNSFTGYSTTGSTVATRAARADAHERLSTILADQLVARLIASAPGLPE